MITLVLTGSILPPEKAVAVAIDVRNRRMSRGVAMKYPESGNQEGSV